MALPKEPRQKMINLMYLVLTALLALNVSSEILNAFKVVDKSLQNSSGNLSTANNTLYESLKEKLGKPESRELATIWEPKAQQAKKLSDDFFGFIENMKKELKTEAGLKIEDGKEEFKEDDLEATTRFFTTKGNGKKLEEKLKEFKAAMLNIDPKIKDKFGVTLPVDTDPPIGQDGTKKDFTTGYFHMTPTVAALTLLSKFQNNIKNSENQVTTFCHDQIGKVEVIMDKAAVLVGQSSNYVMPGQEIEITAGVGSYSSAATPQISIGGVGVSPVDGVGSYKFQAGGTGKQTKTVTVTYKDQQGKTQTESRTIEYTVGVPGGAAVMLDKMNVFYAGVPNPVTISSGSGWDKTTVSMSGGSISGSGSNRVVSGVTPGQAASITVTADGKSTSFQFRCKRIPDPVFKIGTGKARMPAVEFKSQQYCRADLEGFDFDARYSVVSASVYFSGANFPNVVPATLNGNNLGALSANIQRCGPGSSITFTNVKVSGPDGTRVIDERSFTLY